MEAYKIALFVIVLNLSIPIVNALGVFKGAAVQAEPITPVDTTNWAGLVGIGTGLVAFVSSLIFQLPIGATIFALVFLGSYIPASASLNAMISAYNTGSGAEILGPVILLINVSLSFVFIYGFIQFSGGITGE